MKEVHPVALELRQQGNNLLPGIRRRQAKAVKDVLAVDQAGKIQRFGHRIDALVEQIGHKGAGGHPGSDLPEIRELRQVQQRAAGGQVKGHIGSKAQSKIRGRARGGGQGQPAGVRHRGQLDLDAGLLRKIRIDQLLQQIHVGKRAVDPDGQLLPLAGLLAVLIRREGVQQGAQPVAGLLHPPALPGRLLPLTQKVKHVQAQGVGRKLA